MTNKKEPFLVVRDDGFSQFFYTPAGEMTPELFLARNVDYLKDYPAVRVKEMGIGPGSTFTYDTSVGEIFLSGTDNATRAALRDGDINVYENVTKLISAGADPLTLAVIRCHEIGLKLWARFEMSHEYDGNTPFETCFNGLFYKQHPEYRIPGSFRPDFKFAAVRNYKLDIIRELIAHGVDGVSLDFCVYPPFLSEPFKNHGIMTAFLQEVRAMLDSTGRQMDLVVRLPHDGEKHGLDWKTWLKLDLVDVLIPSVVNPADCFDVPLDRFTKAAKGTKCKILACIRPFVGTVSTDTNPTDKKTGIVPQDRPQYPRQLYAKALLALNDGVDGLQIALGTGDIGSTERDGWLPLYSDLLNKALLARSDKEYIMNRQNNIPFSLEEQGQSKTLSFRIADEDLTGFRSAEIIFYSRGLYPSETLQMTVNETEINFCDDDLQAAYDEFPVEPDKLPRYLLFRIPKWWEIGQNTLPINTQALHKGTNKLTFTLKETHGAFRVDMVSLVLTAK